MAAVTKPKSNPDQLEDLLRRLLASIAAPVPVPAPVLEVPTVEKLLQRLVAETESPAGARESTRACGIGKLVQIVPFGTADIGTADSAETHQTGLEWRRMFFMRKVGSWCDSLPHSG